MADINPTFQRMLQYFEYDHLPDYLKGVSRHVHDTAYLMVALCQNSTNPAEVTVGLRKLLEAKDCFVRAMLPTKE